MLAHLPSGRFVMAYTKNPCGLSPRDGATAAYNKGYWDTIAKIQKGKIVKGDEADELLGKKTEKFLDGSPYAGGEAEALVDGGITSPLYSTDYQAQRAYQCLV